MQPEKSCIKSNSAKNLKRSALLPACSDVDLLYIKVVRTYNSR